MCKFIFVTGGVVSSLGKGISGASIGKLLQLNGLKVTMLKCDPYINVDAGTMNPYQHGEVYVTDDGAETDLDLGYYERFLDINTSRSNNITAGSIYQKVISKERNGEFLGATVQVIPHVTNEIKSRFKAFEKDVDVTIIEIGGTVGDIESLPFLEAARQMRLEYGHRDVIYVHVTLIPYIPSSDELKTKPTQHSVNKLREIGIDPNIIICRTQKELDDEIKAKISLFCNVPKEAIIEAPDVPSIYEVPDSLYKQGINEQVLMLLGLRAKRHDFEKWQTAIERFKTFDQSITVAIAGKYTKYKDSYKSISEALVHGAAANGIKVLIDYVDVEEKDFEERLMSADGILIPGGFGGRGVEGKLRAIQLARESKKPLFGICLGMQCIVIEAARNILGYKNADSSEFNPKTPHPVIDIIEEQKKVSEKGGTMRLGSYPAVIARNSLSYKAYGTTDIQERHRHRYEMNPKYMKPLSKAGYRIAGIYKKRNLTEIVEYKDHPWFVGVQFHPEFKSRPMKAHPLFKSFIKACIETSNK